MSASGRLWRRAPAWRLCLGSAVLLTALAALFPPSLPHWPHGHAASPGPGGPAAVQSVQAASAHFVLPREAAPIADGAFQSPPPGPGRSGIMAFAGRQVVLPEGSWRTLVLTRTGAPDFSQSVLLARIEAGALTGMLYAIAPDPLGHATGPLAEPSVCFDPRAIAGSVRPEANAARPTVHECWELAASPLLDQARLDRDAAATPHDPLRAAWRRLDEFHAQLPPALLGATFFRSDETGWLSVAVLFPDTRGAGGERRIVAWIRRYAAAFHRGFDGSAGGSDLGISVSRDPGAEGQGRRPWTPLGPEAPNPR